jgi:hypothetical protein
VVHRRVHELTCNASDRSADEFRSKGGLNRQHTSKDERSISVTATDWTGDADGTGQYAEVNGINLYEVGPMAVYQLPGRSALPASSTAANNTSRAHR